MTKPKNHFDQNDLDHFDHPHPTPHWRKVSLHLLLHNLADSNIICTFAPPQVHQCRMKENKKIIDEEFFEDMLVRVRMTRVSQQAPRRKIRALLSLSIDFEESDPGGYLREAVRAMSQFSDRELERMFNCFCLYVETHAKYKTQMKVKDACEFICKHVNEIFTNPNIYTYACYNGDYVVNETTEGGEEEDEREIVFLPDEIESLSGGNVIVKVIYMDYFLNIFSGRDSYYSRAYAILNELDERILETLSDGYLEPVILVPYKEYGDVIFHFSHFETDIAEPDRYYRQLYIVYSYESTIS